MKFEEDVGLKKKILANQLKCVFQCTQQLRKVQKRVVFLFFPPVFFVLITVIRGFDTAQKTHSRAKANFMCSWLQFVIHVFAAKNPRQWSVTAAIMRRRPDRDP